MKKIIDCLKVGYSYVVSAFQWVRTDGMLHILASIAIMFSLGWFLNWFTCAAITLVIGIAKEVYDKVTGKGCAEWHDLICDGIGIVYGGLILLLYAI